MECLFCHGCERAKLNNEHVLSQPVCSYFGIDRAATTLGRFDGRSGEIASIASLEQLKVHVACEACNGGWMNDLEHEVVDVWSRWLNDGARLSATDLRVMRRWLAKTHLVLSAVEGGLRRFPKQPTESVVPDATLGRMLRDDEPDSFDRVRFAAGGPRASTGLYGWGTPTVQQSGPAPIPSRLATVSYLNLGDVQLWTLGWTLLPAVAHRFPPRLSSLQVGLRSRQLRTSAGDADPASATIDYGPVDIRPFLQHPETAN